MTTAPPPQDAGRDLYWTVVEAALAEVFQEDVAPARRLRADLAAAPAAEQDLFYHAEPFDVAADLCGADPTPVQITAYRHLLARLAPQALAAPRPSSDMPQPPRGNRTPVRQLELFPRLS